MAGLTAEQRAEDALRSLASWLGVGGYNAETVDAAEFERKIRDGVGDLVRQAAATVGAERDRLRAALRRIADEHGRVCPEFETCDHAACADSCGAVLVALDALKEAEETP